MNEFDCGQVVDYMIPRAHNFVMLTTIMAAGNNSATIAPNVHK